MTKSHQSAKSHEFDSYIESCCLWILSKIKHHFIHFPFPAGKAAFTGQTPPAEPLWSCLLLLRLFLFLSSATSQHRNQSALLNLKKVNMSHGGPDHLSWGIVRVHNLLYWYLHTISPFCFLLKESRRGEKNTETRGKKERGGGFGLNTRKRHNTMSVITHKGSRGMWDISPCDLLPLERKHHPSWPVWAAV